MHRGALAGPERGGHRPRSTRPDMIATLPLGPLPTSVRDRLGAHLHSAYVAGEAMAAIAVPPDRLGLGDRRLLGWRIALALALLAAELAAAS